MFVVSQERHVLFMQSFFPKNYRDTLANCKDSIKVNQIIQKDPLQCLAWTGEKSVYQNDEVL